MGSESHPVRFLGNCSGRIGRFGAIGASGPARRTGAELSGWSVTPINISSLHFSALRVSTALTSSELGRGPSEIAWTAAKASITATSVSGAPISHLSRSEMKILNARCRRVVACRRGATDSELCGNRHGASAAGSKAVMSSTRAVRSDSRANLRRYSIWS